MRLAILSVVCAFLAAAQSSQPVSPGDTLFDKQDWAGAAREFKLATERNPDDGRAWFRLGSSLHRLEDYKPAADAFAHAAQLKFQAPLAMAGAARAYAAAKDTDRAVEWLTKAAQAGFAQVAFIDSDPHLSVLKDVPAVAALRERIRLNGKPCLNGPEYRQFDFWLGEWDVQVSGQTIARSRIEKSADGCIVQENWMPFNGNEGKSWNFYNSVSGKWEQLWLSTGNVLKLEGGREGPALIYHGTTRQPDGSSVEQRLSFTPQEGHKVHQYWEQSRDGGKTWTVAFDGIYLPRDSKEAPVSTTDRQMLLDHLRNSQKVFAESIRGLSPAQARFKSAPERWSILECAEHLAQAEQLLFTDAIEGLKLPTGARSTVTTEEILQAWGTRTQKVKSSGDYDPIGRWPDLSAAQKVFDERRAKTLEFVAGTQSDLRGRVCCGGLDIWQQLLAISAHTLRHVQQIEEVKADPRYPREAASSAQAFRIAELKVQRERSGKPWLPFLNVPSMRMGVYTLPAGSDDKQSPHDEDETYYVLRGKAVLRVGSQEFPVEPGSIVYVAAHAEHKFQSIAEPLEVLVFFAGSATRN